MLKFRTIDDTLRRLRDFKLFWFEVSLVAGQDMTIMDNFKFRFCLVWKLIFLHGTKSVLKSDFKILMWGPSPVTFRLDFTKVGSSLMSDFVYERSRSNNSQTWGIISRISGTIVRNHHHIVCHITTEELQYENIHLTKQGLLSRRGLKYHLIEMFLMLGCILKRVNWTKLVYFICLCLIGLLRQLTPSSLIFAKQIETTTWQ